MKTLLPVLLVLCLIVPVVADSWHVVGCPVTGGGSFSSLALDSSGRPHISYYYDISISLEYTFWNGSFWRTRFVEFGDVGRYTSLALDSSDNRHISYYDDANDDLKYARWDGSAWQTEIVDEPGNVGWYTSLALDSSDHPHISYYDVVNQDLKYARWDGSAWQTEAVDSANDVGRHTSLALDSSDNPHISYYDNTNDDLKYARWDGSAWQTEIVDEPGNVGWYTSLALDSSDHPHISYYDVVNQDLEYARWDGSMWETFIVDELGNVGKYTSLALDSSDNPHISYYDNTNDDLKYARWDGSSWQIETVDSLVRYLRGTSLALDPSDKPRISYSILRLSDSFRILRYAWYDDGSGVKFVELASQPTDEGVLLSWSIVGDEPASMGVLRSIGEEEPILLSNVLSGSATSWLDVSVEAGVEYAYYLEVTELDGTVSRFGPSEVVVPGMVSELTLSDPYPNPADNSLTIHYELTQNATVKLHIYDVAGRLVETLVSGEQTAGRHSVNWDSSTAATGVYLLRLEANGEAITKRAVISR